MGSCDQAKDLVKHYGSSEKAAGKEKIEFSISSTFSFLQVGHQRTGQLWLLTWKMPDSGSEQLTWVTLTWIPFRCVTRLCVCSLRAPRWWASLRRRPARTDALILSASPNASESRSTHCFCHPRWAYRLKSYILGYWLLSLLVGFGCILKAIYFPLSISI